MKTLDRYVFTECLPPLVLSGAVFTFVLLMHRLLKLSDLVVARGVPLLEVLRLLSLALPSLLPLLMPVSLLLSVLLGFGRLSADSEVIAMRACGIGLARNTVPVLWLSSAVLVVAGAVSLWLQPLAARAFQNALYEALKERISATTQAGVFTELADGVVVYAGKIDTRSGDLSDLFLYLDRAPAPKTWVFARSGAIRSASGGLRIDLRSGEMHQYPGRGGAYRRLRFSTSELDVPLPSPSGGAMEVEELSTPALLAGIGADKREARLEFHRRLALPASCLVFGVLGAALGVHHARAGKSRGVVICLAVLLAYYALLTVGRVLGKTGALAPEVAMWLPNLALGAAATYAFRRKNREAPLPLEGALGRVGARLRRRLRGDRSGP